MDTHRPRLLLADDHQETRDLLSGLLRPEFDVIAEVENGRALVDAADEFSPDVIVSDISMAGCLDGIAAATVIRRRDPAARIIFVTVHRDLPIVERGLATGALGYVLKNAAGEELVAAVQAALRGEQYVSPALRREKQAAPVSETEHTPEGAGVQAFRRGSHGRY